MNTINTISQTEETEIKVVQFGNIVLSRFLEIAPGVTLPKGTPVVLTGDNYFNPFVGDVKIPIGITDAEYTGTTEGGVIANAILNCNAIVKRFNSGGNGSIEVGDTLIEFYEPITNKVLVEASDTERYGIALNGGGTGAEIYMARFFNRITVI